MQPVNNSSNNEIENLKLQRKQIKKNIRIVKDDFLTKVTKGMDERQAFEEAIDTYLKKQLKTDQFEKEDSLNNKNDKKLFMASKLCKGIKPGKILDYLNAIDTIVSFTDMLINILKKDKNPQ